MLYSCKNPSCSSPMSSSSSSYAMPCMNCNVLMTLEPEDRRRSVDSHPSKKPRLAISPTPSFSGVAARVHHPSCICSQAAAAAAACTCGFVAQEAEPVYSNTQKAFFDAAITANASIRFKSSLGAPQLPPELWAHVAKYVTGNWLVALSSRHALVVSEDDKLWGAGDNPNGQLVDYTNDIVEPAELNVPLLAGHKIIAMAAGEDHSVLLIAATQKQHLIVFGGNARGQCGFPDLTTDIEPTVLHIPLDEGASIVSVAAGSYHTVVRASNNIVYVFGANEHGQLGLGYVSHCQSIPTRLNLPRENVRILQISASGSSTAILTDGGIYVFGANERGQLGLGHRIQRVDRPMLMQLYLEPGVSIVALAVGGTQTVALRNDGKIMVCGRMFDCASRNSNSGRGLPAGIFSISIPQDANLQLLDIPHPDIQFTRIAVAEKHVLLLALNGSVYCYGCNCTGQLGIRKTCNMGEHILSKVSLDMLEQNERINQIAASGDSNMLTTNQGRLIVFGANESGKLGDIDIFEDDKEEDSENLIVRTPRIARGWPVLGFVESTLMFPANSSSPQFAAFKRYEQTKFKKINRQVYLNVLCEKVWEAYIAQGGQVSVPNDISAIKTRFGGALRSKMIHIFRYVQNKTQKDDDFLFFNREEMLMLGKSMVASLPVMNLSISPDTLETKIGLLIKSIFKGKLPRVFYPTFTIPALIWESCIINHKIPEEIINAGIQVGQTIQVNDMLYTMQCANARYFLTPKRQGG